MTAFNDEKGEDFTQEQFEMLNKLSTEELEEIYNSSDAL